MCTAIATVFRFTYFQISGWNSIKNLKVSEVCFLLYGVLKHNTN